MLKASAPFLYPRRVSRCDFLYFLLPQLMAPTWCDPCTKEHDGLTTNGVALMRPVGPFDTGVCPGQWTEVTIMGNVRQMRNQRSSRIPGEAVSLSSLASLSLSLFLSLSLPSLHPTTTPLSVLLVYCFLYYELRVLD